MWRAIVLLPLLSVHASSPNLSHLDILKTAYPYGLLTDDYGVLTLDDLKANACDHYPAAFSEDLVNPYQYWQCFPADTASMICYGNEYDSSEKKRITLLVISARLNGVVHEYLSRRTIPLLDCREYQREWRRLTKDVKQVCISGALGASKWTSHGRVWSWIYEKYKTKKGCDSYFDQCDVKKTIAKGECPAKR